MSTHFLVVPQWQGSGSSRAMRLIDGANAICGDLPAAATTVVELPAEAGEALGTGVHRYSALLAIRAKVEAALRVVNGPVIVIGGDCAADAAGIHRALTEAGPGGLALLWLDAHGDLNTPETSPSGAYGGMALRGLLGDGATGLASPAELRIDPGRLVLAGVRSLDDAESAFIDSHDIRVIDVDGLARPDAVLAALEATGAGTVYIHVDLDVIDPAAITGLGYPEPFGLAPETLAETIRAVRARFLLAGGCVAGFAPSSPDAADADLSVILRTLAALTAPLG